jgi:ribosomal protein S18 acetylase RimI-like enzyme
LDRYCGFTRHHHWLPDLFAYFFFGILMKNQDVAIRPYAPEADLKKLSSIWLDASRLAHPFIGEQRLLEQRALIEDQYLPSSETWVAFMADEACGFISLLDTFIGGIFISPNRQGLGIGRQLISHALGLKGELELEVYIDNQQAVAFYTKLGFQELSRRPRDDEGYPFANARLRLIG